MRFFSFSRSVIDWDESTYILIAEALLQGKVLYKDVWDTKPPGIFLLFAGVRYFFENTIFAIRILATIFVSSTAFFLYLISKHIYPKNSFQALFTGIFYVSLISFNGFSFAIARGLGLEANTELFFIFFTVVGFYFYFIAKHRFTYLFLSGLALGIAFMIKYFVLFDILALGCIVLLQNFYFSKENNANLIKQSIQTVVFIAIGVLLPFLITVLYFYFTGYFSNFWKVTFEVGKKYSSAFSFFSTLKFLADFIYLTGVIAICFFAVIINLTKQNLLKHKALVYWLIWVSFSIFGACYSGKNFYHYLYPIFPAFSLISGYIFAENYFKSIKFQLYLKKSVVIVLFVSIPVVGILKVNKLFNKPDYPKIIAEYVGKEPLFVDNYYHIVHHYNNTLPLSSYYHPSLLYKADHINAIGINPAIEIEKIFNKKPTYVLYKISPSSHSVQNHLLKNYYLDKTFGENVFLFKRKE